MVPVGVTSISLLLVPPPPQVLGFGTSRVHLEDRLSKLKWTSLSLRLQVPSPAPTPVMLVMGPLMAVAVECHLPTQVDNW